MAERVRVREISNDEGNRLLKIVRRSSGSIVTWRRAQIVLWSAQGMDVGQIAPLAFTSEDRVREVIHNFNADGFDSLYPKYAGGRPPKFTLPQRREIKKIALGRPQDYGLPFSTWSLTKLAEHLVAKGVVDDISHEGLRVLLREEGVSFQAVKTWKESNDRDFEAKKNRILELYDIADGKTQPGPDDPVVVICMDEFGPLNLQPHPGKQSGAHAATLPMKYIDGWRPLAAKAEVDARAESYWQQAPYEGPVAETLVSNALQVVQFVAEFLPPGITGLRVACAPTRAARSAWELGLFGGPRPCPLSGCTVRPCSWRSRRRTAYRSARHSWLHRSPQCLRWSV